MGILFNQLKLGSQFVFGQFMGCYIVCYGIYVSFWWLWVNLDGLDDDCGYGIQMLGLVIGLCFSGGLIVGVVYKVNLIVYCVMGDVVINGFSEKNGVKDVFVVVGNCSDVKIISMLIGDVFWSNKVVDGVYYVYNRGKFFFVVVGIFLIWINWWGVIFFVIMLQMVVVIGVKEGYLFMCCSICYDGFEVDFIVLMQCWNDNGCILLMFVMSGNVFVYVGGFSVVIVIIVGVVVLVWVISFGFSCNIILNRLKNVVLIYLFRDSNFGWGMIDVNYVVNNQLFGYLFLQLIKIYVDFDCQYCLVFGQNKVG